MTAPGGPEVRLPHLVQLRVAAQPDIGPILKWPGGKSLELPAIAAAAPLLAGRYVDPFVGGGSVLLAVPGGVPAWANDACPELIGLFRGAAGGDDATRSALGGVADAWDALGHLAPLVEELAAAFLGGDDGAAVGSLREHGSSLRAAADLAGPLVEDLFLDRVGHELVAKFERMRRVQVGVGRQLSHADLRANVEGSIRSSFYMALRARYNRARLAGRLDAVRLADFFALRELGYAAMFRFNARGEFNVPYGGVTYNRKSLGVKVDRLFEAPIRKRLGATTFRCGDFEPFLEEAAPGRDDFVFVDPPYDSDFSEYDGRHFDIRDQLRLRDVLLGLPSRVMVVIKDTPAIRELYSAERWHILEADKTYMWTIKSRNDRTALHLTITSYVPDAGPG